MEINLPSLVSVYLLVFLLPVHFSSALLSQFNPPCFCGVKKKVVFIYANSAKLKNANFQTTQFHNLLKAL